MTSKKISNKEPARAETAVPGVPVLPYGLEGAARFNQWVEDLIRALLIKHPGLGDWWTADAYEALEAYEHAVGVPPAGYTVVDDVRHPIAMPPTEAAAYRKKIREIRLAESVKAIMERKRDLPMVYSKLFCVLTREGINQVKNLPEWATIDEAKDPIQMKHAIIKTHSTSMLAGTAQQSKYRSFQDYMACQMSNDQNIHQYGTEFSTKWQPAAIMGNEIAEQDAAMTYFMGLSDGYRDLKTQKLNEWAGVPGDTIETVAGMKALASTWVLPSDVLWKQLDRGAFAIDEAPPTGKNKKNRGKAGRGNGKSEPEGTQAWGNQSGPQQQGQGAGQHGRGG